MEPLRVIAHSGHAALVNDVSEHSERLHSQPSSRTTCRAKLVVELAHDKTAAAEGYWDSKYGRSLVNEVFFLHTGFLSMEARGGKGCVACIILDLLFVDDKSQCCNI